jgi:hypothetical protein
VEGGGHIQILFHLRQAVKSEIQMRLQQADVFFRTESPDDVLDGAFCVLEITGMRGERREMVEAVNVFDSFLNVRWDRRKATRKFGNVFAGPFQLCFVVGQTLVTKALQDKEIA